MDKKPLSERQRRFVEAYMGKAAGNASEAARLAGYKGTEGALGVTATRTLRNARVQEAILERTKADPAILDRKGLQRFWTNITNDGSEATKDRLAASKLLGKSQGEFTMKHEHSGHVDATIRAVLESTPQNTEDRVVAALRADKELWTRIQARVEEPIDDQKNWESTMEGIPRIEPPKEKS